MRGTQGDEEQPALPWSRSWGTECVVSPAHLVRAPSCYTGKRLLPSSERDSRVTSHLVATSSTHKQGTFPTLFKSSSRSFRKKSQYSTYIVCCSYCLVTESYPALLPPYGLYNLTRLLSPWDFLGENTGASCHFLLQGIFPTKIKPASIMSPALEAGSLPLVTPGKPLLCILHDIVSFQ